MRWLLATLLMSACDLRLESDDDHSSQGGAGQTVSVGSGNATSTSTTGGPPPPESGVCLAYKEAALPEELGPYETTCTPTSGYFCAEELGCETRGVTITPMTGIAISACVRSSALSDTDAWPAPNARAGIFVRAVGPESQTESHVGLGTADTGESGWYAAEGPGAEPAWVFSENMMSYGPAFEGVTLCYDGSLLVGRFWYGPWLGLGTSEGLPVGLASLELGLEVVAPPGVDMLGAIRGVEVDTFPIGPGGCDDLQAPDCY